MIRLQPLLLTAALLAPVSALAVSDPTPGPKDSRIRTTRYDPRQVLRLTSTGLSPVQVILDDGERPVTIAGVLVMTDPKEARDWLARPSGNVLILQPLRAVEPSVLFVRTVMANGLERHYSLELRTREGTVVDPADGDAYMTVRVTYPPSPRAVMAAPAPVVSDPGVASAAPPPKFRSPRESAVANYAVQARFAQAWERRPKNNNYDTRDTVGCPLLAPRAVFDDGTRTTLLFAPHAVLPEIYVINQDGREAVATTVNDTMRTGLRVVVPTVQREMRLRRGGKVCALRNNAFDPEGVEPGEGSGTISPDVVRRVRGS